MYPLTTNHLRTVQRDTLATGTACWGGGWSGEEVYFSAIIMAYKENLGAFPLIILSKRKPALDENMAIV